VTKDEGSPQEAGRGSKEPLVKPLESRRPMDAGGPR
jgi:hypothetical protein